MESGLSMTGVSWSGPLVGISTEPYFTGQDLVKVGAGRILSASISRVPPTYRPVAPRMADGELTWPPGGGFDSLG